LVELKTDVENGGTWEAEVEETPSPETPAPEVENECEVIDQDGDGFDYNGCNGQRDCDDSVYDVSNNCDPN